MFGFAATKCGKCEKSAFKVQELSLKGELDYKIISVQCTYCKTPIGIIDNNNALLRQQRCLLAELADRPRLLRENCTGQRRGSENLARDNPHWIVGAADHTIMIRQKGIPRWVDHALEMRDQSRAKERRFAGSAGAVQQ